MALIFNLPSQIVVQTAAQWAVDATVYSAKRILVTSDLYYGSTDQRKWKLADGAQTWSNLDYMIDGAFQPLDGDLTAIGALSGTSGYLKKTAANTWALQSNSSLTSDLTSTGVTAKTLSGGTFTGGVISTSDTILQAFEIIDDQIGGLSTALIVGNFDGTGGTTMAPGTIIVGSAGSAPNNVALTLNGTGGTFALSGSGELTMPNADTTTRGLLTSSDWNTFNNKQASLVSGTNIKTINSASILGSGDISVQASLSGTGIVYSTAGTISYLSTTGSGTTVALSTSPAFTTPNIGVASGTSLTLSSLTSGRVPYATTSGLLTDSANFLHNGTVFSLGGATATGRLVDFKQDTAFFAMGSLIGTTAQWAGYINQATPNASNYAFRGTSNDTVINAPNGVMGLANGGTTNLSCYAGKAGFGITLPATARVQIVDTAEQFRVGYNSSNYYKTTVGSTGIVTFDAVGAGSSFVFSDTVQASGYKSSDGSAGVSAGPYTVITSITVKNGLITAITGS